jgi:di/tricarboxylate transporter
LKLGIFSFSDVYFFFRYETSYTAGVASLLVCALVASIAMCALGILSEQEVRDAINWEVFITIAAAFGIGTALVNSGVAYGVANFLVTIGTSIGSGGTINCCVCHLFASRGTLTSPF